MLQRMLAKRKFAFHFLTLFTQKMHAPLEKVISDMKIILQGGDTL